MRLKTTEMTIGLWGIISRELRKFVRQRERLISSLVRPLLWLLIFASGMNNLLGVSIIPPYRTYTPYQEYIVPGLIAMIVLFQSMQSAFSLVYDREAGVMQAIFVTPLPRAFILFAKILAATVLALLQGLVFLLIAALFGVVLPWSTFILAPLAIVASGLMLGAVGLVVSVYSRQIENFAGMMNFVIFPMFFLSSALYPLWKLRESGAVVIYWIARLNPFTYAVELIRYTSYGQFNGLAFAVVVGVSIIAFALAVRGYDPFNRGSSR